MKRIQSINPFTEKLNAEFDYFSKSKALERIKKSRSAFSDWEELSPSSRGSFFRKLSDVLGKKKRNIAEKITQEMGKPIRQALTEIERCMNICTYFADHAEELMKNEIVSKNLKKSYVAFQPLGIILGIMPWNYPIIQTFRFAIPTLLAGNVVVLKPASNVPLCGLAIEESFREAGFPEGVFQTLLIDASTAIDLIREDIVNGVSLTGSFEAGSQVASAAGSRIKKVVLELANDTEFGLGATVWTGDVERGERLARRIRAGFVGANQIVRSDPRLPFGGTKMSGIGRELSYFGVREFTNIKTVVLENQK